MLETILVAVWGVASLFPKLVDDPHVWALLHGEPAGEVQALYETKFDEQTMRAHNIRLASLILDGSPIAPNGEYAWSFNRVLGQRTEERGYRMAPVLNEGEVMDGIGGGVCQVSSTVFAAALLAGLDIVERHPHARESKYIPKGYDATVNFPESCVVEFDQRICFDLKMKNPYDFPLMLRARAVDGKLVVWITGDGPVAKVTTHWRAFDSTPFQKRWVRRYYPGHKPKRKQSGQNGLEGALLINIDWPGGKQESKTMPSNYKPVDEVWWVGRDWDKSSNPWE